MNCLFFRQPSKLFLTTVMLITFGQQRTLGMKLPCSLYYYLEKTHVL